MDVSIITVTWNSEEFIAPLIFSIRKSCKSISYEHIIVDNASTDKTVEIIERQFPQIQLIRNTTNLGFAAANNLAVKGAKGKFFLFLNPDMQLEEGSLDSMIAWLAQHSEVGIAGCKLVSVENKLRAIHKPTRFPTITSLMVTALKLPVLFPNILSRYTYSEQELSVDHEVDSVRGSCMFMRREIFEKIGFVFDPRYFLWFEDVDICREAKKIGYKIMFTPVISCVDYAGQSFKKQNWIKRQKQFFKSAKIYLQKWEPSYKNFVLSFGVAVGLALIWLFSPLKKLPFFSRFKNAIER